METRDKSEIIAERLISMTPEELLTHIRSVRIQHPEATRLLDVLIAVYREVCELRLEEVMAS